MAALRDLGPAATAAVPTLIKLADEDDLPIAAAAIEAISRIDPARCRPETGRRTRCGRDSRRLIDDPP